MQTMNVVQSDHGYQLSFTLQDSTATAIDLTGSTVTIKAQAVNGDVVKFTGTLTIDTPAQGTCHYVVQSTDFDAEGRYNIELTITYPGGEVISFVDIMVIVSPMLPRD